MGDIHPGYYVQTVVFEVLSFLFLLIAASTSLAQMFIPTSQRQAHHLPILRMIAIADILQIVHQLDPYAMLGIYSTALAHFLQYQVTSMMLYAFAFCLSHNFKTLYNLTQKPVPKWLPVLQWTFPILHHLVRTVASCFEFTIDLRTADATFLSKFIIVRTVTYNITSGTLLLLSAVMAIKLTIAIRSFIRVMEQREQERAESTASNTPEAAAANNEQVKVMQSPTHAASDIRARIESIKSTFRQVMLGTLGINLVIMVAFGFNASRLDDIAHNNLSRGEFVVSDPSKYGWKGSLTHVTQMVHLALFTWYTWRSPLLWLRSPYSIMTTLSFGYEVAVAQARRKGRVAHEPIELGLRTPTDVNEPRRIHVPADGDSFASCSLDSGLPPFSAPTSPATGNRVIVVCAVTPRNQAQQQPQHLNPQEQLDSHDPEGNDVGLRTTNYPEPSTTIQIPVPPFNSMIGAATRLKQESLLPPISEQHIVDMQDPNETCSLIAGESAYVPREDVVSTHGYTS